MRHILAGLLALAALVQAAPGPGPDGNEPTGRRMSFHNRLLLNRAVLAGAPVIEVLLLLEHWGREASPDAARRAGSAIASAGGRVLRSEPDMGYLRIELPPERLLDVVELPAIAAYQISSFSLGTWYRDGPPMANATMQRTFETTPLAPYAPPENYPHLPELTHVESRAAGFTADADSGVGEWSRTHPTFDGRGVTIALVESALPSFTDPVLRTALTLDGQAVPKIAGILNAIDPGSEDDTRVRLDTPVESTTAWARVDGRTYILPGTGRFRMGVLDVPGGANLVHRFAVLQHEETRDLWIDSNGDASFQDETPLADVNERFDPRLLKLSAPRRVDASFVVARTADPHIVHVYLSRSGHQTMTASVAAGNVTPESLASGVAPHARVLLVRISSPNVGGVGRIVEGFLMAARRRDVDVISASTPIDMVPDTAADFVGSFFTRLVTVSDKPILNAAGNTGLALGQVFANGSALSVGGIQGPATYEALYGGARLPGPVVHVMSGTGPSIDGSVKPDFLAPMERIAATLPWTADLEAVPHNAPTRRLPPGYTVSCCTSASSPYAAGVIALLISAARQSNVPYSAASIGRALRTTAREVAGFPAHQQGNGVLDVNAAWRELSTSLRESVRIVATTNIVHPLAQYATRGPEGTGILEFGGWTAGTTGRREIRLRRESGPVAPVTYRLVWNGNDGTFSAPDRVRLPLGQTVRLPVTITTRETGAHSALLTLVDATGSPVFRTQATVVAAETFDDASDVITIRNTARLMRANAHYFSVPPGTGALAFELEVHRGVVNPTILPAHGLFPSYYLHVHPMDVFSVGPGTYRVRLPDPEPGTWTVRLKNSSAFIAPRHRIGPRDVADAEYTLRIRRMDATLQLRSGPQDSVTVESINDGSQVAEPQLELWTGGMTSHRERFRPDGLSNLIPIQIPEASAALTLDLRADAPAELFLYDCTTGQCFSYDIAFPAASAQRLVVRQPAPGRWIAAVSAAPFPKTAGSFELDEVITTGTPVRATAAHSLERGARWIETIGATAPNATTPGRSILQVLLLDARAEREESERPWSTAPNFVTLRDRPVALGTAVHPR